MSETTTIDVDIALIPGAKHWMMIDLGRPFILINDDSSGIGDDPVTDADILPISVSGPHMELYASWAWSSNVEWIVVIAPQGLVLLALDGTGWLCAKRSSDFIRRFLEAPYPTPKTRRRK